MARNSEHAKVLAAIAADVVSTHRTKCEWCGTAGHAAATGSKGICPPTKPEPTVHDSWNFTLDERYQG